MPSIDRRTFLTTSTAWLACTASAHAFWPFQKEGGTEDIRGRVFKGKGPKEPWQWSCEAHAYKKMDAKRVVCQICPNRCLMAPGDRSACRSKANIDGVLYSLAYGNPCAVNIDPVEKKPLYHFLPGSRIYSLAAAGCNFRCLNCQNWQISQSTPEQVRHSDLSPERAVADALENTCQSIAYTYSEPITFFEYMLAIGRQARPKGVKNVLVSNGYINAAPLRELCGVLDGANINLKAFSDDIYRKLNGGRLAPVLETFKVLHDEGVHFEMTNLVVPGYTDKAEMVKQMCGWILDNLGPDYPLHFLRFFPRYKLDRLPATPVSTLVRFRDLAKGEGVHHVYLGNVPGHEGNHTYCPGCGKLLVERQGYQLPQYHISGNRCHFCKTRISGVWSTP